MEKEISTEILSAAGKAHCIQCANEKRALYHCKTAYHCIWKKDRIFTAADGYGCPTCKHFLQMFLDNLIGKNGDN